MLPTTMQQTQTIDKPKNSRYKEGEQSLSVYIDTVTKEAMNSYLKDHVCKKTTLVHAALRYYLPWFAEEANLSFTSDHPWRKQGNKPKDLPLPKEVTHLGDYFTVYVLDEYFPLVKNLADYFSTEKKIYPRNVVMRAIRAYLIDQGYLNI